MNMMLIEFAIFSWQRAEQNVENIVECHKWIRLLKGQEMDRYIQVIERASPCDPSARPRLEQVLLLAIPYVFENGFEFVPR